MQQPGGSELLSNRCPRRSVANTRIQVADGKCAGRLFHSSAPEPPTTQYLVATIYIHRLQPGFPPPELAEVEPIVSRSEHFPPPPKPSPPYTRNRTRRNREWVSHRLYVFSS